MQPACAAGVEGRQHEVAAVGCADRGLGRNLVANLADHHDVGGLPQHVAEQDRKIKLVIRPDLGLVETGHFIFDRVFDRVDLAIAVVEIVQAGVERVVLPGRWARSPGSSHWRC